MNRIYVQALYVTKLGRTYRSQTKVVNEGQELFDFECELKYQLALKDYPIEFVNEHGHKQYIQPSDVETIIAAQLGYEVQAVAPVQEELLEPQTPSWAKQESVLTEVPLPRPEPHVNQSPRGNKFNTHLPFPEPPRVKVRIKSTDPDNETTQEIPLPFAAPKTVARTIAQNDSHGPTRMGAYGTFKVRMGAGTDSVAPTP